jgi:hypothetical protein
MFLFQVKLGVAAWGALAGEVAETIETVEVDSQQAN